MFNILAAIHKGRDIYPPVEIRIWISFFFSNINDFKVKKITFRIDKGNKMKLFNLGVSIIRVL